MVRIPICQATEMFAPWRTNPRRVAAAVPLGARKLVVGRAPAGVGQSAQVDRHCGFGVPAIHCQLDQFVHQVRQLPGLAGDVVEQSLLGGGGEFGEAPENAHVGAQAGQGCAQLVAGVLHQSLLRLPGRGQLGHHRLQRGAQPAHLVAAGHGESDLGIRLLAEGFGHLGEGGQAAGDPARRKVLLSGLDRPYGLALWKEFLYVAEAESIKRYRYDGTALSAGKGQEIISLKGMNKGHWTRSLLFDKTGDKLYVGIGSEQNVDQGEDPRRAAINRVGHRREAATIRGPGPLW